MMIGKQNTSFGKLQTFGNTDLHILASLNAAGDCVRLVSLSEAVLILQQANVHAILESDSKVANVRDSLNDALALLDDVNENLATFDTKLLVMREDIAAIEVMLDCLYPFGVLDIGFPLAIDMRRRRCITLRRTNQHSRQYLSCNTS